MARLDGDGSVLGFTEKPRSELWVNAGFFCFERAALELLEPGSVLEREPLERLAAAGELRAFRHEGFWECMDTYKDWLTLNDCGRRVAPRWNGSRRPRSAGRASETQDAARSAAQLN